MKRSDFFIRLTTGVLFLAVAFYIGIYLYNALANTYETTRAIRYDVYGTISTQGFVVRTETVLDDLGTTVLPMVAEGERVAAGQAIAVELMSPEAIDVASEIRSLSMKIAQLDAAQGVNDAAAFDAVLSLSAAVHTSDLRRLDEIALSVETGIFSIEEDADALRSRLAELEGRSIGTRTVYAPVSGAFSQVVDGFEHIPPEILDNMVPSDLLAHFRTPVETHSAGKLITEHKWFFAAIMNHEDAILLTEGDYYNVHFLGAFQAEVNMLVESKGRREDDSSVVLFSSNRGVHEIAQLRLLRADIIIDLVSGIRVPKEAIHLDDDGTTFVFLQTSGFAERVVVERLRETDNYDLVRDGAESGTPLRVDSIIIVRANNLYHGKVVP